jgi:(p)ppGpp synthase/HD superfamily hydrolase
MKNDLNKAIKIASDAHEGQTDKAGKPYILHPLRLLLKFTNIDEMIVAVLHDVVEDSELTLEDLKINGFEDSVVNAVDCLTKRSGEEYSEFIKRVLLNELARKIKIEDIKDNLDLSRLSKIETNDLERISKYHNALKVLSAIPD